MTTDTSAKYLETLLVTNMTECPPHRSAAVFLRRRSYLNTARLGAALIENHECSVMVVVATEEYKRLADQHTA